MFCTFRPALFCIFHPASTTFKVEEGRLKVKRLLATDRYEIDMILMNHFYETHALEVMYKSGMKIRKYSDVSEEAVQFLREHGIQITDRRIDGLFKFEKRILKKIFPSYKDEI